MDENLKKIENKLEKALDDALRITAEEIGKEIQDYYVSVIEMFYHDYTPHSYDRTESTYLASGNIYKYPEVIKEGDSYIAGIDVTSDKIPGQPYRACRKYANGKEWVFRRTFERGIHGYTHAEFRQRVWDKKKNQYKKHYTFKYYASTEYSNNMKAMRPSPAKLMEKKIRSYRTRKAPKEHINEIFTEQLTNALFK